MTLKTKLSLLVFLTTVSIVSVGFSSWSISIPETIQGNIEVDNVGYFDFDNSHIQLNVKNLALIIMFLKTNIIILHLQWGLK